MTIDSSATAADREALSAQLRGGGLLWGLLGVLAFSFTLPATRVAVGELDPVFVGGGRALVAATLGLVCLVAARAARPAGAQWLQVAVVAGGVVIGFPLLTSIALQEAPAAHGAVVIGLLPAATAVVAVLRGGEHPSLTFWCASLAGAAAVVLFTAAAAGGLGSIGGPDLLLLGAVVAAAIGYAEGGLLARRLGSWQVICWALLLAAPLMLALTLGSLHRQAPATDLTGWACFGYVSAVSMFLGFFAWYRGLAIGPIATVSQTQLVQPVLTICWAALLLHESLDPATLAGAAAVIGCATAAVRARVRTGP